MGGKDYKALLVQGVKQLDLAAEPLMLEQLSTYIELLIKWNKVYNLTAITQPEDIAVKHLLDSLAIAEDLRGERVLDVGTGAGLPGIPLACAFPNRHFTLVDRTRKKIRFIQHCVQVLGLKNVEATHSRMQDLPETAGYDVITCRALGAIQDILEQTERLLKPQGVWLFMKGASPQDEMSTAQNLKDYSVILKPLFVPFLNESRHLVSIQRKKTPLNESTFAEL